MKIFKVTLLIAAMILILKPADISADINQGLIAHYPLDGNANDVSGNSLNGTVNGATPIVDRLGNLNAAYNFDGIDDYIILPVNMAATFASGDPVTFSLWFKTSPAKDFNFILGARPGGGPAFALFHDGQGGEIRPSVYGQNNDFSNTIITKETWHHAVFGTDGINTFLYVDGILQSESPTIAGGVVEVELILGARQNIKIDFFKGEIDDFRVYDRALSIDEILELADIEDNLIAYYSLNGNANDLSINNLNGTIVGATPTTDRFKKTDSAYLFDGIDDYISLPVNLTGTFTAGDPISISLWFKTSPNINDAYVLGSSPGNGSDLFARQDGLNGTLDINIYRSPTLSSSDNVITDDQWHHAVFGTDGTESFYFLDGRLQTSTPTIGTFSTETGLLLGANESPATGFYAGKIDDVRIYKRALTVSEVMRQAANKVDDELIVYYPLDGNASDISRNQLDGTIFGATPTADRFGNPNSAYAFDGIDDYISLPLKLTEAFVPNEEAMSVSVWFRAGPAAVFNYIIGAIPGGGPDTFAAHLGPSGKIAVGLRGGTTAVSDSVLADNLWHHLAFGSDGVSSFFYVDGVSQNQAPISLQTSSETELLLGARQNPQVNLYAGDIDEVRVFRRLLTPSEITQLATSSNINPLANSGPDQTTEPSHSTILDGRLSSDPDNNIPLSYHWKLATKPLTSNVEVSDRLSVHPSFIPDVVGDYIFELSVVDRLGDLSTALDTVTISTLDASTCEMKTDYTPGVLCAQSTVNVTNDIELDAYLIDFGYNGSKYQNVKIAYDISRLTIDIHSPCKITIKDNMQLSATSICLDGRNGIHDQNGYTVIADSVALLSENDKVEFGKGSIITTDELIMTAHKNVKIGISSQVDVDGPIILKSTGDLSSSGILIKKNSVVSAESLSMEASRHVILGNNVSATIANKATMSSTGSYSDSEVKLNQNADMTSHELDMISNNKATLGINSSVSTIGTFNMNAADINSCSIAASALINAGIETGNCL